MVIETLTMEVILSLAMSALSVLAVIGIVRALMVTLQSQPENLDIDELVQRAPYQRLHNVVRLERDA